MADSDTYVLIDARGMALHAFHSGKDPEGQPVPGDEKKVINGPAWGIERLLLEYAVLADVPPRRLIAVWDAGNEYRTALWPAYKAKRKERRKATPVEMLSAMDDFQSYVENLLAAIGVTQVSVAGVEADDVIAYLCSKLPRSVIYTKDQDLLQLQGDYPGRVQVVLGNTLASDTHKDVPSTLVRLYKSIVGDSADEYPGITGLGDKAFQQLLGAFGADGMLELQEIVAEPNWRALEGLLAAVEGTPEAKLIERLYDDREHWHRMYLLAKLEPALCEGVRQGKPITLRWSRRVPSTAAVLQIGLEVGLPDLGSRFKQWLPTYTLAESNEAGIAQLQHLLKHAKDGPIVAFDYETYDKLKHKPFQRAKKNGEYVDVLSQEPTGVSFAYGENYQHVFYMPCNHKDTANFKLSNISWMVNEVAQRAPLVAHNAPFEYTVTAHQFGILLPTVWDTRLMASHVDENDSLHLKDLSKRFLHYHQQSYKETLEKAGAEDMRGVSGKQVLGYGCDDSIAAAHLFDLFWLITTCEGTWEFVRDREFKFLHEQDRGFRAGVTGDMDVIQRLDEEATKTLEESTARVRELLQLHCSDYNEAGATNLYDELAPFTEAKAVADGKDSEAALDRLWDGIAEGSRYIPYTEVKDEGPEWKPTPKKLSAVAAALALPPIEKDTKAYITQWVGEAQETVSRVEWQDNDAGEIDRVKAAEFVEALGTAAHLLKKREGPEYQALVEICTGIVGEPGGKVRMIGDELNFGSPKQMQQLLYAKLGLPIRIRSKVDKGSERDKLGFEGAPSTDDLAIAAALAEDVEPGDWRYEVLDHVKKIKTASTSLGLFLKPMPLWVRPDDGRIHPSIQNCGTVTRRPSGSSPNFLQLTKKDGGELRGFVKPWADDHVIISADFNGQELRITASESLDPALLDAYIGENRKDVHSVTAAAIAPAFFSLRAFREQYGLPDEYAGIPSVSYEDFIEALHDDELHKAMNGVRKPAKSVNFLITYMGGYTTLARKLLIKEELAKQLMDQTFARYYRLKPWQQETIEFAKSHGYTQTAYGTRRHLPRELFSSDDSVRSRLERQAVNFTIQGCAADILKTVMASAYETKLFEETGAYLIAPVYDELAASVPLSAAWEYCARLKEVMEVTPPGHKVPMVAEFSVSANSWGDLIELGAEISEEKVMGALEESRSKAQ